MSDSTGVKRSHICIEKLHYTQMNDKIHINNLKILIFLYLK